MAIKTAYFNVQDATVRIFNYRNLRHIDWLLPILVTSLAVVGWATLYSACRSGEMTDFHKQVGAFFIGLLITAALVCVDYRFLVAIAPAFYLIGIVVLFLVLQFGDEAKGSTRWLMVGPIRIQPSEFMKIIMVYALTWYFTTIGPRVKKLHWFLLAFILAGIPMALILKQPNLGTAASMIPLVIAMLFVAGCRIWHLAVVVLLGLSLIPIVGWQMQGFDPEVDKPSRGFYELEHYQKKRIYAFLHPESDPRGINWHTYQSMITVGSGGFSGKGYLQGTQTRLNYLPEHHTDFIFSLLAEERGFIGSAIVIGLFAAFLLRGLMFARDCPEMMGTLLAVGVVTLLAFHVFVNVAITIGLMPVTGIPLPFLSYGRSFYLTTMALVGILLNVPMRRRVFVNG